MKLSKKPKSSSIGTTSRCEAVAYELTSLQSGTIALLKRFSESEGTHHGGYREFTFSIVVRRPSSGGHLRFGLIQGRADPHYRRCDRRPRNKAPCPSLSGNEIPWVVDGR